MDVLAVIERLGITVCRVGQEEAYCLCPLHDDRRPSLSVRLQGERAGLWTCYRGCGAGRLVDLVVRVLALPPMEALRWLEESSSLPSPSLSRQEVVASLERRPRQRGYLPPYRNDRVPTWALERGFTRELLRAYGCGYSPYYDALVIPLVGADALCYRRHPRLGEPRYRYTAGFKAHAYLYGWWNVDLSAGHIILVEGPLDLLWLRQHDYGNSLAIMGGGRLGQWQARALKALGLPVVLALDNDDAGRAATEKVASQLSPLPVSSVDWSVTVHCACGLHYHEGDLCHDCDCRSYRPVSYKDVAEVRHEVLLTALIDSGLPSRRLL